MITLFAEEMIFRAVSDLALVDWAVLRIFIGVNIVSLILSALYSFCGRIASNILTFLTALIGENPKQAEKFTTKLSKVYRYVLEQKSKDLIELDEELEFAKTYMELLKMRFENAVIGVIIDKGDVLIKGSNLKK